MILVEDCPACDGLGVFAVAPATDSEGPDVDGCQTCGGTGTR